MAIIVLTTLIAVPAVATAKESKDFDQHTIAEKPATSRRHPAHSTAVPGSPTEGPGNTQTDKHGSHGLAAGPVFLAFLPLQSARDRDDGGWYAKCPAG